MITVLGKWKHIPAFLTAMPKLLRGMCFRNSLWLVLSDTKPSPFPHWLLWNYNFYLLLSSHELHSKYESPALIFVLSLSGPGTGKWDTGVCLFLLLYAAHTPCASMHAAALLYTYFRTATCQGVIKILVSGVVMVEFTNEQKAEVLLPSPLNCCQVFLKTYEVESLLAGLSGMLSKESGPLFQMQCRAWASPKICFHA